MRPEPARETSGLGRNCDLFDRLRYFAYRKVLKFKKSGGLAEAWRARLFSVASGMNGDFARPLSDLEVRGIAKSVAKWTWLHFTQAAFSALQSKRAHIRWRGHVAASTTKPWETQGISPRTYYRRKKKGEG